MNQYIRHESTAAEYYGNHEPYVTKKPRTRLGRSERRGTIKLLVGLSALAVIYLMEQPFWSALSPTDGQAEAPPTVSDHDDTAQTVSVAGTGAVDLNIGDSFSVGCNLIDAGAGACMTVTLEDVQPEALCQGTGPEEGRFARVTLSATMLKDADIGFISPFRVPQWTAFTAGGEARATRSEFPCGSGVTELNRLAEVPGATATGSYWLPVPDDATVVEFTGYSGPLFRVPVALQGTTAP